VGWELPGERLARCWLWCTMLMLSTHTSGSGTSGGKGLGGASCAGESGRYWQHQRGRCTRDLPACRFGLRNSSLAESVGCRLRAFPSGLAISLAVCDQPPHPERPALALPMAPVTAAHL
jgi:hypothetical protein